MKKNLTKLFFVLTFSFLCFPSVHAEADKENMEKTRDKKRPNTNVLLKQRKKLFDEGNFGMFIHWGLYSQLAGRWDAKTYYGIGEWIMHSDMADIPIDDYKKIANEFNPSKFNAREIAQLAKDAGMKYLIITSKHHDGFAMFDSDVDSFNIVDATPFAHDPMKELSAACRDLGLGFGFYYSHNQDWTFPGGTGGPVVNEDGTPASFENYFYSKCLPQVTEICSNYGKLDFVWFDTPGVMKKDLTVELVNVVRDLQPMAMIGSRVGYGMGDYETLGDMEVPSKNIEGLWETCDTNNDSWSYVWYDNNFKSPKEILHRLVSTVGRGGTYLFNVGPDQLGQFPKIGASFLQEVGSWIQKYPQVIYDAGSSPWKHALPWGDVTTQDNSLLLSVFDWPQDGKLYLPGLKSKIESVNLINKDNGREKLSFTKENDWTIIELPYQPADFPASAIDLRLENDVSSAEVNTVQGIYPNIKNVLTVEFASVSNAERSKDSWMEKFGEWKYVEQINKWGENSKAVWNVDVFEPGYYYLELRYKGDGKVVSKISTDEGIVVQNQQDATRRYANYPIGIIEFKTSGEHSITVSFEGANREDIQLESIIIRPIQD